MKLYGLIGFPLEHSFSKKYFVEKFRREGFPDHHFELFSLKDIHELPLLLSQEHSLLGLAVTIPYKQAVIPFLNEIDPTADAIGAVNCIKIEGSKLTGYNTDVLGFETSLRALLKPNQQQALVLGSGGSSKAVQYALKHLGIPFLIVSRNPDSQRQSITYEEVDQHIINDYPLIINCTPVGMYPNIHDLPSIPYQFLNDNNLLYDLIYRPEKTNFLQKGEERGTTTKNGYEMLILQAEENWKIWNDL